MHLFIAFIHSPMLYPGQGEGDFQLLIDIMTCPDIYSQNITGQQAYLNSSQELTGIGLKLDAFYTCMLQKQLWKSLDSVYLSVVRLITNARSSTHHCDLYQMTDGPLLSEWKHTLEEFTVYINNSWSAGILSIFVAAWHDLQFTHLRLFYYKRDVLTVCSFRTKDVNTAWAVFLTSACLK